MPARQYTRRHSTCMPVLVETCWIVLFCAIFVLVCPLGACGWESRCAYALNWCLWLGVQTCLCPELHDSFAQFHCLGSVTSSARMFLGMLITAHTGFTCRLRQKNKKEEENKKYGLRTLTYCHWCWTSGLLTTELGVVLTLLLTDI
jgi:hypothetical protein